MKDEDSGKENGIEWNKDEGGRTWHLDLSELDFLSAPGSEAHVLDE